LPNIKLYTNIYDHSVFLMQFLFPW